MRQINLIVVHCTASRNGKARPVAGPCAFTRP